MKLVSVLRLFAISGIAAGAAALGVSGTTSCASTPDSSRFTQILEPDYNIYKASVDTYLQRRCGTLDCHGQAGRPYRIYGFAGFRLYNEDAGLVSGQQPTTEAEVVANFQAAIALEPEEMSRLMATQGTDPNKLLLLRKPLRLERHKGGPAMAEDDPGYRCVVAWLRIPVVRPDGDNPDFVPIPPAQRAKLSDRALRDCAEATNFP